MIIINLEYVERSREYQPIKDSLETEPEGLLYLFVLSMDPMEDWIATSFEEGRIYIWDFFDEKEYDTWEEVPKLDMSLVNHNVFEEKWKKYLEHPVKYLNVVQDDNGWIDLVEGDGTISG